jgi:hypothetical protein
LRNSRRVTSTQSSQNKKRRRASLGGISAIAVPAVASILDAPIGAQAPHVPDDVGEPSVKLHRYLSP